MWRSKAYERAPLGEASGALDPIRLRERWSAPGRKALSAKENGARVNLW